MATKRFDCVILGKKIGTYEGWERIDDDDIYILTAYKRNLVGKKAFPDFVDGNTLTVSFFGGTATQWDAVNDPDFDDPMDVRVDWAIFND